MSEGGEKIYEMFWDCEYCGTKKLLGKSQRHCPECGAAQNSEKRYFPPDDEKIAVDDHKYVGADLNCPACSAPNSAAAKFCCECGSPLEEASEVKLVEDDAASPVTQTAQKEKGSKRKVLPIIIGVLVLLVVGFVLLAVFWTKTVAITAYGHTWQREIKIESFVRRNKSEWCDRMPRDAYNVSRSREVRSHKQIPDGEECSTRRVDRGDGTFKQEKVCKTKYRKEPVYDQKCRFTVNRWDYARSVTASGRSLAETPKWPLVTLKKKGTSLGAEREGTRVETYTVHLIDTEKKTSTCNFNMSGWRSIQVGSKWSAQASVITGLLDCATLKAHGTK